MPLSTENGSRKSTETDAQQSRDMWAPRRSSESGRLSDEAVPLSQMGDVDALIKWNAHDNKRKGNQARKGKDPPVLHKLTREHIRAWKSAANDYKVNFPRVNLWSCMYCLHYIDYHKRPRYSRFRCAERECVGRGKLQVNYLWNITESVPVYVDGRSKLLGRSWARPWEDVGDI
ncbi:uncharacterized protein ALTATR162_LOCUS266 [Alternaria atra]|uniref:Uncharacterized protein n=1 Tax=Alternaria atra TaxID=119953 RepID=A0A8J2N014_9PLEO|nr:uncharacterized protein ALTATR162_LOCUS266 [Alternaria atra]CAG5137996.1 unnamed protein product [Alternaria atra]